MTFMRRVLPTLVWLAACVLVLAPLMAVVLVDEVDLGSNVLETLSNIAFLLVPATYAITGAVVVSRQPRNSVGWMLLLIAMGINFSILAEVLAAGLPPSVVTTWMALVFGLSAASWVFFIFPIIHLLLTFPNGRLLSPRLRPLVGLEWFMASYTLATSLFGMTLTPVDGGWTVDNPIGFIADSGSGLAFEIVWTVALMGLISSGLISIVLRFRRARTVERQQIKWLLFAVSLFTFVFAVEAVGLTAGESGFIDLALPIALVGIGVAIAVAVLRYRLFDIDRFISRTVTYAAVVGVLVVAFVTLATAVGTRVSEEPVFVAAATLIAAALFNPLRRRFQAAIDRRFNRSHYDAVGVMDDFVGHLREQTDAGGIAAGWASVVTDTMQPSTVGVWIRD